MIGANNLILIINLYKSNDSPFTDSPVKIMAKKEFGTSTTPILSDIIATTKVL